MSGTLASQTRLQGMPQAVIRVCRSRKASSEQTLCTAVGMSEKSCNCKLLTLPVSQSHLSEMIGSSFALAVHAQLTSAVCSSNEKQQM